MACDATFNSPCFLFAFLPLFLLAYWGGAWALRHRDGTARRWRLALLVAGGLVFYSLWDWRFAGLLVVAALVDYALALRMAASPHRGRWLAASVAFNLGLLAFFKYATFALANARSLFDVLGVPIQLPYASIVLPIGISFYTFKTMSYTIDVYRGEIPATRDLLKYLAFLCVFVDLVAGPIIRYRDLSDQLDAPVRRLDGDDVTTGVSLFALGLFKKVIIADTIALQVDPVWSNPALLTTPMAWLAAVGFALQLYYDFSGYSDMAIGLGVLLGLRIPRNFDAPYQALNPSDFWRRWHISLSSWLRDYLYVPLGGSRRGEGRMAMSLMVVMVLGGLWHGAAWTFVAWGAYHGVALVAYHRWRKGWDAMPVVARRALLLLIVVVGWVLFRAGDLSVAAQVYHAMFVPTGVNWLGQVRALGLRNLFVLFAAALAVLAWKRGAVVPRTTTGRAVAAGALVAVTFLGVGDHASPFLYYQF